MIYMALFKSKNDNNKDAGKSKILKNIGSNFSNTKLSREELEEMDFEETVKRTVLNKDTPFSVSEAYKSARTNIMFSLKDVKGGKSIIVTSGGPGEGKSTSCINLAISFAQMGSRVVLVDADMRKPKIHRYFKCKNKEGLSNVLGGFCELDSTISHNKENGIDIITAGHIPPNPAELIASHEMDEVIAELTKRYDYVFIDTPPINVVTDASLLAKKTVGVILVVRYYITNRDDIEKSIKSLNFAGARIAGLLFNGVEKGIYLNGYRERRYGYRSRRGYSYDYGYGYGEKYGNYSYNDD